ncbi:hypothetical protein FACS1894162_8620 [Bacteroidia bacterium]|nr:hypothetical protein FACS1894162_8620 [Bacteroidia bacterium]
MKLNQNNIFVDTNILVGAYAGKLNDINCLNYLFSLTGKQLFVSSLSIAQFVSVFQKRKTNDEIKSFVYNLLSKFTIISFEKKDILDSLNIDKSDMEDNIQYILSRKLKCFFFVTNNKKDYSDFLNIKTLNSPNIRLIKKN